MNQCIYALGEARIISKLDANADYWQVEIDLKDREKIAFKSHQGLYGIIRIPFGLKNAPGTFNRVVDVILSAVRWKFALVYLDDIVIFSRTPEEHLNHLRHVLRLLKTAGVTLNLKSANYFQTQSTTWGMLFGEATSKFKKTRRAPFPDWMKRRP